MNYAKFLPAHLHCTASVFALSLALASSAAAQDGCQLINGVLPEDCEQANAATVVNMPPGETTEFDRETVDNDDGFVLSIDGAPVNSDKRFEDKVRETDKSLEKTGVQVRYDALGADPKLDVKIVGGPARYEAGDRVTVQSRMNYPAFVVRGEIRVIDSSGPSAPRTVAIVPIDPNGTETLEVPQGADISVVHRVYDAKGRFDETAPLSLTRADERGLSDLEEGSDSTAIRRIPVRGTAVTVSGDAVDPQSPVEVLGETTQADANGRFVLQRIVPAGAQEAAVTIRKDGFEHSFEREFETKAAEWFYVGAGDLTWSRTRIGGVNDTKTTGRISFYVDGVNKNGVRITSSLDTGEEEIGEIFRRLDEKDPASLLSRLDPRNAYPVYGDDSTIVDNTPTSGKIYFKAERDGNHLMWGDYRSTVNGADYIRNERELYGAQLYYGTQQQTSHGAARAEVELFAAQPDTLPMRDVFRGTGGSVYFLQRQDVNVGSETVTVQVLDAETGRVISRRTLQYGADYDINYIQGVVTLTSPLLGSGNNHLIQTTLGGDTVTNLVVQYDHTPTSADIDGFTFGGRAQAWANDKIRIGVTGISDQTTLGGTQLSYGADVLFRHSETTYASLEYARSEGPGYASTYSFDGGLTIDTEAGAAGTGEAYKFEFQLDARDLGLASDAHFGGYFERRTEGFSTLDYQVPIGTGDETLYGIHARLYSSERLSWKVYADVLERENGSGSEAFGAEVEALLSEGLTLRFAAEHLSRTSGGVSNSRTDIGAELRYAASPTLTYSIFGQTTVSNNGLSDFDRFGIGIERKFSNGWTIDAELSDGTGGLGGELLASYQKDENSSYYFGYTLDPGRVYTSNVAGTDGGKFVVGGNRRINDRVSMFGENTYDIFGARRTLNSAYGVEYKRSEYLTYETAIEIGRIIDPVDGNFDRTALSLGARYQKGDTTARGRLEYRIDRGVTSSTNRDSDTLLLGMKVLHKFDEERRLLFSFEATDTKTDNSSILSGDYVDATLGYAFRPTHSDKWNVLLQYRYLNDMYGQSIDGVEGAGPVQESHVFSIDTSYDLNENWTLGGKLGIRKGKSAADATSLLTDNNAALAVLNARYHLVHNWDVLIEARSIWLDQADVNEVSLLGAVYRHVGNNFKIGVGYNFGTFSDDLNDLVQDDKGLFINILAKF